jgi:hypothetical protein
MNESGAMDIMKEIKSRYIAGPRLAPSVSAWDKLTKAEQL